MLNLEYINHFIRFPKPFHTSLRGFSRDFVFAKVGDSWYGGFFLFDVGSGEKDMHTYTHAFS